MSKPESSNVQNKIAVIGMSGRFPGAKNLAEYWENIRSGKETISSFSDQELLDAGVDAQDLRNPNYVKARGIYEGTFQFDAPFFGYSPREAECIDPQQRVFLECAWETLENAGYDPTEYAGRIGVFGGMGTSQYMIHLLRDPSVIRSLGHVALLTSNEKDYLATRVGYNLNLRGPCLTVQTACSTSLVAVTLACQSLLTHQADMALAGGVYLDPVERGGYFYSKGGICAPDGHCRVFDALAEGTVFSCGAGVVALKRLEDALAAGDTIRATIIGFGINNDGSAKAGFTAPGVDGQHEAILDAIAMAGISPETIGYVECHGTATTVGDPVEVAALAKAFRAHTKRKRFCAIGSVKSNIGHTDAAAGVASLIKAVLSLEHHMLVPSLNYDTPNPKIDFENSPFFVSKSLKDWSEGVTPRRAGVSSFGIGGTNAHIILEETSQPEAEQESAARPWQLLPWSARTSTALESMTENLNSFLQQREREELPNIAYTMQVGRKAFPHRRMLVCRNGESPALVPGSSKLATGLADPAIHLAFLFPGQGSQYVNMGREIYESESIFREEIDRCSDILRPYVDRDIRGLLYPRENETEAAAALLTETRYAQPALFVIEYALSRLLSHWGIYPDAMIGHSVGEYVAACLAEVISLEDALRVVAERGRLMQQMPPGAMVGVLLPDREVRPIVDKIGELSIAAVNAPTTSVVSGPYSQVEQLEGELKARGVVFRRLHTSHAFHSAMMDPILETFQAVMDEVPLHAPKLRYLSNVTGTWITDRDAMSSDYWVRHLRHTVRFGDNIGELLQSNFTGLVEVGPGRTLIGLAAQHSGKTPQHTTFATLPHPEYDQDTALELLLSTVGKLWVKGVGIEWTKFNEGQKRRRVPIPTYPFERQEYRLATSPANGFANRALTQKKPDTADWFYVPSWKRTVQRRKSGTPLEGDWLLFVDDNWIGTELVSRLKEQGREVITATPGDEFSRRNASTYVLRPHSQEDYVALLRDLRSSGKVPAHIVHLWPVTCGNERQSAVEDMDVTIERCFYSPLFLAQALGREYSTVPIRLHVVSNNLYDVGGEAVVCPEKATLEGPCKTIPREYLNIQTGNIDLDLSVAKPRSSGQVDQLLAELDAGEPEETVAFRGGHRWIQYFEDLHVDVDSSLYPKLRERGVYLITGGLGAIGLTLAEHMARAAKVRLVLLGRSQFPARNQWERWLRSAPEDDATARKIGTLRRIEELGSEILLATADVSDERQIAEVIRMTKDRFGDIHGVIHSAGTGGGGIIDLKSRSMVEAVFAPKIRGTIVLERSLEETNLDFFMLCSSQIGVTGLGGLVDYAAANAFLDAFSHSRSARNKNRPISVNWGRWDELGMAVENEQGGMKAGSNFPLELFDHPVFVGRFVEDASDTYVGYVSPEEHWFLREHRLMGKPTMVGTAYLELARAAFVRSFDAAACELRDIVFVSPLRVEEGERRELRVVLEKGEEHCHFEVKTRVGGSTWQCHAVGRIRGLPSLPNQTHELDALFARCRPSDAVRKATSRTAGEVVDWGAHWKTLVSISVGDNEAIATIQLSDELSDDLQQYALHPALLDMATGFAAASEIVGDGGAFLPISYNTLQVFRPLPRKFHSHIRYQPGGGLKGDFTSVDVMMLDEAGEELAEARGYSMKRVSESMLEEFVSVKPRDETSEAVVQDKTAVDGRRRLFSEDILPEEGAEVFRRLLSMESVPQVVISTKDFTWQITENKTGQRTRETQEGASETTLPVGHPRPNLSTAYVEPRNELERSVAEVWERVFGIAGIGVDDNFLELGGQSLLAVQIASRLREMFEVELEVAELYKVPTVAGIAEAILKSLIEKTDSETLGAALNEIEAVAPVVDPIVPLAAESSQHVRFVQAPAESRESYS